MTKTHKKNLARKQNRAQARIVKQREKRTVAAQAAVMRVAARLNDSEVLGS
jgi:hypothetical protein